MARPHDAAQPPAPTARLVVQVIDDFLEWAKHNRAEATYDIDSRPLQKFGEAIPRALRVSDLRPSHVTRVMDANSGIWSDTKRDFAVTGQRAFKWAEKQGLLDQNPLRHVEKPAREAREMAVVSGRSNSLPSHPPCHRSQGKKGRAHRQDCQGRRFG